LVNNERGIPERTLPRKFRRYSFLVIIAHDPFHSFNPVVKNKLQFSGLNLIQKLDDHLKKLINIIECTSWKRCLDMTGSQKSDGTISGADEEQ
jgi:hypothetical protein